MLAQEEARENKWYIYAMEMVYQKILKIVKKGSADEIGANWRIGFITEVESISALSLENRTYVTSSDQIVEKCVNFIGLLINKASFTNKVLYSSCGVSYGIIRLRELEIIDKGRTIKATVWGTSTICRAKISDSWWNYYWSEKYSSESVLRYQNYLSAMKRKVFAVVEKGVSGLTILKLIVA